MPSKARKPHINNKIYFCLTDASIPEAITVKTLALSRGGVVMNNSCSFFLQTTSCSASVCVGMFMHEAFIIELWRAPILWENIWRDDSNIYVQLPLLHKLKRWRQPDQILVWRTEGVQRKQTLSYNLKSMSRTEFWLSAKTGCAGCLLRSIHWFPTLTKLVSGCLFPWLQSVNLKGCPRMIVVTLPQKLWCNRWHSMTKSVILLVCPSLELHVTIWLSHSLFMNRPAGLSVDQCPCWDAK